MRGQSRVWSALTLLFAVCAGWTSATAQAPLEVQAVIARVGARVAQYYERAQRLICIEPSTAQPIESNWSPDGMARTVESELHVETGATDGGADPDMTIVRKILRINGRAPRERDRKDEAGCSDPELLSQAPLDFLLPAHRHEFKFTSLRESDKNGRPAIGIDFKSVGSKSKPQLNDDPRGHSDCYQMSGSLAVEGRVWVDAKTYDVLRLEQHIEGPVAVRVPWKLQRRDGLPDWVTLDRDDLTLDYTVVAFSDPDEALLLPSSADEMDLWRSPLQSVRHTEIYSDYHRFLTSGHVIRDAR